MKKISIERGMEEQWVGWFMYKKILFTIEVWGTNGLFKEMCVWNSCFE